jgi:hypothetical protein
MTPWKMAMEVAAREAAVTWLTCPHSEIADAAALAALSEWTAEILRALPEPPEFRAVREAEAEPVAWRVRVISDDPEEWSLIGAGGGADYLDRKNVECRPLFARPPAREAEVQMLREAAEHITRLHQRAEEAVALLCGLSAHPSDEADVAAGMLAGAADRAADYLARLEERLK